MDHFSFSAELKVYHEKEIEALNNKIKFLESQNFELDVRLATITSERDHLRGYVSAMDIETKLVKYFNDTSVSIFIVGVNLMVLCRKMNSKFENLERELQDSRKHEGNARNQAVNCIDIIHKLVQSGNLQSQPEVLVNDKDDSNKVVEH